MSTRQVLGIIGAIILFIGVFAPIVSFPLMGNMTYLQNGRADGVVVLVLAGISLILALSKYYKGLWITGVGSFLVIAFTFIRFQMKLSKAKAQMESHFVGKLFNGLADVAMQTVQLQWGWALLIVGAALTIACAAMKEDGQPYR